MFCKYCGSEIVAEAEFCPECGKKLSVTMDSVRCDMTDDIPSRQEFFSAMGSLKAKKWIRTNWITWGVAVVIRIITICILLILNHVHLSGAILMRYFLRLVFGWVSIYLLLLFLACHFKRRDLAIAALLVSLYIVLPLYGGYTIWDAILGTIELVTAVVVMINTNKLEKEYRASVGPVKK